MNPWRNRHREEGAAFLGNPSAPAERVLLREAHALCVPAAEHGEAAERLLQAHRADAHVTVERHGRTLDTRVVLARARLAAVRWTVRHRLAGLAHAVAAGGAVRAVGRARLTVLVRLTRAVAAARAAVCRTGRARLGSVARAVAAPHPAGRRRPGCGGGGGGARCGAARAAALRARGRARRAAARAAVAVTVVFADARALRASEERK